jgi:predicted RNA-binding Zn-ribbon protein involved in translation (DUF1610 family)
VEIDIPVSPLRDNDYRVIGTLERKDGQYIGRCQGLTFWSNDRYAVMDWVRGTHNTLALTMPEHAVCNTCGWEGTEDEVQSHICPWCGQPDINYFNPDSVRNHGTVRRA